MYKPHLTKYKHVRFHIVDMPGYVVMQMVWINQKGMSALSDYKGENPVMPAKPIVVPASTKETAEAIINAFLQSMSSLSTEIEEALANKEQKNDSSSKVAS